MRHVMLALPFIVAAALLLLSQRGAFRALSLGEEAATSLLLATDFAVDNLVASEIALPAGEIFAIEERRGCERLLSHGGRRDRHERKEADGERRSNQHGVTFIGWPPCVALLSAAKITANVLAASGKLVSGISWPASSASKKA